MNTIKTVAAGAKSILSVAVLSTIASTSAVGALWATGDLDTVMEEACQVVGAARQPTPLVQQVVFVPVGFSPAPTQVAPRAQWGGAEGDWKVIASSPVNGKR